jgi:hypothetical protein
MEEPIEEPDEPDEQPQELDPEEKANIEADLEDLGAMREVFSGQQVRGVVIACPDCNSNHYYDWELLKENLEHMLDTGEPRMHEPAFEPKEDDYVQWDYGKGYIDALADTGLEADRRIDVAMCPWCETPVDAIYGFCPRCGRSLAAVRIYEDLKARGIDEREVRAMLVRAGFEPF